MRIGSMLCNMGQSHYKDGNHKKKKQESRWNTQIQSNVKPAAIYLHTSICVCIWLHVNICTPAACNCNNCCAVAVRSSSIGLLAVAIELQLTANCDKRNEWAKQQVLSQANNTAALVCIIRFWKAFLLKGLSKCIIWHFHWKYSLRLSMEISISNAGILFSAKCEWNIFIRN